jgi:mRNA interferase YafQ
MRKIDRPGSFKRDYKREAKGPHRRILDAVLIPALRALVLDQALPSRFRDHDLNGDWVDHRECHLKPDLLLIYRKVGVGLLILVRVGSHSELFG